MLPQVCCGFLSILFEPESHTPSLPQESPISIQSLRRETPCRVLRPSPSIEGDKRGVATAGSDVSFIEQIGGARTQSGSGSGGVPPFEAR